MSAAAIALCAGVLFAVVGCTAQAPAQSATTTPPSAPSSPSPTTQPPAPSSTSTSFAPITVLPPTTESQTPQAENPDPTTDPASSEPATTEITTSSPAASTSTGPSVVETTADAGPLGTFDGPSGTVIVIDPGHNGQNAKHPEIINKLVPAGFGQMKACNTTGTSTNAGYAEHAFNWQVSLALKKLLEERGIAVVLTRDSDDGVGPCVNDRADAGNSANAAAVISIHGDGAAAGVSGFFVMTASRPPAGAAIAKETDRLAAAVRDGMVDNGFHVSNTLGKNGLWARSDLGGLNLSLRPTVMVECGNMRNAAEAKLMSSPAGQQRYAEGLARGILAYLGN